MTISIGFSVFAGLFVVIVAAILVALWLDRSGKRALTVVVRRVLQVAAVGAVIVAVVVGVMYYRSEQRAKKAGIVSESIVHEGDTWKVDFVARIPAPSKDVFSAIEHVEDAPKYNPNVKVKVLSQDGNKKTVEMEAGTRGMPAQMAFEYFPDQNKITYATLSNPMIESKGEYLLTDEGRTTKIDYHQTTKMLTQVPAPDAIIKQLMRGIFVAQLEGLKSRLHISLNTEEDSGGGEEEEP
jgi:hypothetical protein